MKSDHQIFNLIKEEDLRQRNGIELIASENFVSNNVMNAAGSCLTNKYAEGYPNKRYYGGCEIVDQVEQIAIDRAKKLFGVEYVNVQPHSGSQANSAVMLACLNAGDKILGFNLCFVFAVIISKQMRKNPITTKSWYRSMGRSVDIFSSLFVCPILLIVLNTSRIPSPRPPSG